MATAAEHAIVALPDSPTHARAAGLRHASDREPGITREGKAESFRYRSPSGRLVRDAQQLARIRALAIPPAWRDVWICADDRGHLQATGRDARGRKQYRYHRRWRATRDEAKFERARAFAEALPRLRARVARDLRRPGLPRAKVLAAVTRLLETTLVRVGNSEYARENGSFGLTTIRNEHAAVRGSTVRFRFRGKAGKMRDVTLEDPRVARVVKRCQELPGQELFCYQDEEGEVRDVTSTDVNAYLREVTEQDFTAKDFRTWAGTMLCAAELASVKGAPSKRQVTAAIARVADRLGNTPSVCRKCYVHPRVVDAFLAGEPIDASEAGVLALLS